MYNSTVRILGYTVSWSELLVFLSFIMIIVLAVDVIIAIHKRIKNINIKLHGTKPKRKKQKIRSVKPLSNNKALSGAKRVALIAVCTALIEGCKLALSFIPNVEVVTLLCALFGYAFGWYGVISVALFVCIEPLIWGFGSWIIYYFIYWPLVAIVFMFFAKLKLRNRLLFTVTAVILTIFFGVLSAVVDVLVYSKPSNFVRVFPGYYLRGMAFYIIQVTCNMLLFPIAFIPLSDTLVKLNTKFHLSAKKTKQKVSASA